MSLWELIFGKTDCSQVTAQKDKQIQDLTNSLSNLTVQNTELKNNYLNSANMVKALTIEKDNQALIIKQLQKPVEVKVNPPDIFLNGNSKLIPYFARWLVYFFDGKGISAKRIELTPSKLYKIWSDAMYEFFNNSIRDCKTFDEKAIKLRDIVVDIVDYKLDVGPDGKQSENWRTPLETYYSGIGDCDDSTILWVTACNMCGLPKDRYFNATGIYNKLGKDVGHSFGIARFDDGTWRVIETTSKATIKKLVGSDYHIKGILSGITNDEFYGQPKSEQF